MTETEWATCDAPETMLSALLWRSRRPSGRKLRLFACACCRHVPALMNAEYSPVAVDAVEQFADGLVDNVVLSKALLAAWRVRGAHWSVLTHLTPAHVVRARSEIAALAANGITERQYQADLLRDIFTLHVRGRSDVRPEWLTDTVLALAGQMYERRDFSAMPILADALQDAGCDDERVLGHCRCGDLHARGCWVVDLLLDQK